ncbi:MAG: excinuclease ABC subunit UvrC, partial [Oscillospiraceae bacterium]|nr:excinuclease ABC subunit UvrC [Oscillospiraceae bacterium]
YHIRTRFKVPQRGDNLRLCEMAKQNAREEVDRITGLDERINGTLHLLGKMLQIDPPVRIESFDISNISGTDMVSSMVVFYQGQPRRSEYKRFQIRDLPGQDDYAAMHQTLTRRFAHYLDGDEGFSATPDLLLIDGGQVHAGIAVDVLEKLGLSFPVFGMVKDDRHRTRALVTSAGEEIRIDNQQSVFSFVGRIQEETHRFAISYHRKLRSRRLRYSELDKIPKIGPKRKQDLLKRFKSVEAVSAASVTELEQILPKDAANAVYEHFRKKKGEKS